MKKYLDNGYKPNVEENGDCLCIKLGMDYTKRRTK